MCEWGVPPPRSSRCGSPCPGTGQHRAPRFHAAAHPSFPCVSSTFSLHYCTWLLGQIPLRGKPMAVVWMVGVSSEEKASPHSILVCFSLARITPPTPASHRTSTPSISAHPTTLPTSPPAASAPRPSPRPPMSSRRLLTMSPTRVLSHWPVSLLNFAVICARGLRV